MATMKRMANILIHPSVVYVENAKNTRASAPETAVAIHNAFWLPPNAPTKNIITVATVKIIPTTNGTIDLLFNSILLLYSQFSISVVFANMIRIYVKNQIKKEKKMVLYYTCSGSSKRVAEIIAKKIEDDVECMNADVKNGAGKEYYSSRPYVIVCPVFNMGLPVSVKDYLEKSSFGGNDDIVFVAICSYSSGNTRRTVREIFRKKQRSQIYSDVKSKREGKNVFYNVVIMPSTNVFARAYMSEKEKEKVVARAEEQSLIIAHSILKNEYTSSSVSLVGVIGSALNPLIVKSLNDKRLVVTDKCTACGKCVEACSYGDLKMKDGKVEFLHKTCNHCSACVNLCPEKAIVLKNKLKNTKK